jgi:formate hydrogenlyase subunit 6/NADH:ubiquinone oxidoreductase subunit I
MFRPGKMMKQVLGSVFKKAATTTYPFGVKKEMCKNFRGKLRFYPEKCICCKLCMRDCPSGAISVKKTVDGKMEAEIDLARCIYCGQCVDVCPKKALESTPDFELAQVDGGKLKVVFSADTLKDTKAKT